MNFSLGKNVSPKGKEISQRFFVFCLYYVRTNYQQNISEIGMRTVEMRFHGSGGKKMVSMGRVAGQVPLT